MGLGEFHKTSLVGSSAGVRPLLSHGEGNYRISQEKANKLQNIESNCETTYLRANLTGTNPIISNIA